MKRIVLMVTVAMVMVLMLAVAGPALATVHPLSNSECSGLGEDTVAGSQDPPGLTPGALPTDTGGADVAQPVVSVVTAQGPFSPAFKTFPSPDAPIQEYCPAPK
jgi:hypothetical protein